jgi:response regulator RpfG family c-di-GMP phosphodiesterase
MTDALILDGDTLTFADDQPPPTARGALAPWKILIVDDEEEVHRLTRWVLADFRFGDRGIEFISAYSRVEAEGVLRSVKDIAIVLLDVVMEEDDAGLRLAHFIREDLQNTFVRIVLRTGQPGQAPEHEVIADYDINDYKAKTELTTQKLFTTVTTALRGYRDIMTIEASREGLEHILDASSSLFEKRSMTQFIEGVVLQIQSLLHNDHGAVLCSLRANRAHPDDYEIVAASGVYSDKVGQVVGEVLPDAIIADITEAYRRRTNVFRDDRCAIFFQTHNYEASVVYVHGTDALHDVDRKLMEVFCSKVAIGFDNVYLFDQLAEAQKAVVYALARMAEHKDQETGDHVRRVEMLSDGITRELLARCCYPELTESELVKHIGLASILHDVGKVGVPDAILQKPGRLDPDERAIIERHAGIGQSILDDAGHMVQGMNYLNVAAEIAGSHHEKFDGSGYPRGLAGDAIPLSGRIVAVADVFDALVSTRPYKKPWTKADAIAYIQGESGRHFDPLVVEAFLAVAERTVTT